jgi:hypothetical protein
MSDEQLFVDLEARVDELHSRYQGILNEGSGKIDSLKSWNQEIEDYQRKAESINTFIDSRLNTLESIGGMTAKFDVEMELQKLKGLKSMIDAKESELDVLKQYGDKIAEKGSPSLVDGVEKEIFQRWDDLEKKIKSIENDMETKLRDFERDEVDVVPPVTITIQQEEDVMREVVMEEDMTVMITTQVESQAEPGPMEVDEVVGEAPVQVPEIPEFDFSALEFDQQMELAPEVQTEVLYETVEDLTMPTFEPLSIKIDETPVIDTHNNNDNCCSSAPLEPRIKINVNPPPKITINVTNKTDMPIEPLKYRIEDILITIETIQKSIEELRCTSTEDIRTVEENVQKLEEDLEDLQPTYESLLEEARDVVGQVNYFSKIIFLKLFF